MVSGKTIEALSLINLRAQDDFDSAMREVQREIAANPNAAPKPRRGGEKESIPLVRDRNGAWISRATLIICP